MVLRDFTSAIIAITQTAILTNIRKTIMATAENGNLFTYGTFACTLDAFLWRPLIQGRRSRSPLGSMGINTGEEDVVRLDLRNDKRKTNQVGGRKVE